MQFSIPNNSSSHPPKNELWYVGVRVHILVFRDWPRKDVEGVEPEHLAGLVNCMEWRFSRWYSWISAVAPHFENKVLLFFIQTSSFASTDPHPG